jgi:class 3 adenylate cyclase
VIDSVAAFFRACETGAYRHGENDPWLDQLAAAMDAEVAFDFTRATSLLDQARASIAEGPFRKVFRLVELRVVVRKAKTAELVGAIGELEVLAAECGDEPACRGRTLHLLSVAQIRLGRLDDAERVLAEGVTDIEDGPARIWMFDTMAQVLTGQGAWTEAIRTLEALVAKRRELRDAVGMAISAGHLSRLHLQLGRPAEAAAVARDALGALGDDAPALTRLRLQTLLVTALLDANEDVAVDTVRLGELLSATHGTQHYLRGYGLLTHARALSAQGDEARAEDCLSVARKELPADSHVAFLYEARIHPDVATQPAWRATVDAISTPAHAVSEAEIELHLLLARYASTAGDAADILRALERAHQRAVQSNNPLWLRMVDDATKVLAPELYTTRLVARFSGRSLQDLQMTAREEVTIIFADLVNFTPRALEMTPDEVMDTVRCLFELGVPLLAKHRVNPISYMGDGLLALAQGPHHSVRGLAFARDLLARCGRISQMRRALGERWALDLRAGVASGVVVLGALGTLFKTEFAAIGVPTNLAARLQSSAGPGEVMCSAAVARASQLALPTETLRLKGFEKLDAVEACRIRVYTPES